MNDPALRVIKLGGSLLESPDYAVRFMNWFKALPPARTLLLVGGGPPVDALRELASLRAYDTEFLHWLCIDAMDLSYRLVQQDLGSSWSSLADPADLPRWLATHSTSRGLVHVRTFYRADNYRELPVPLPLDWDTTSDSLAALLAQIVKADELILVKSCKVDPPYDWSGLADAGIVDRAFAEAMGGLESVWIAAL